MGDDAFEPNETFSVWLTKAEGALLGVNGTIYASASITNDDQASAPIVTISPRWPQTDEGNSGLNMTTLTVALSSPATTPIVVNYKSRDIDAIAGTDYVDTSGALTFAPGETTKTINVPVIGDEAFESDEYFEVILTSADGAVLGTNGTSIASVTIRNEDKSALPVLTISPGSPKIDEGNSGVKMAAFNVALSTPATTTVYVDRLRRL